MEQWRLSPKIIGYIAFSAAFLAIILPNIFIRLWPIPVARALLFACSGVVVSVLMATGLLAEYLNIRFKKEYAARKENRIRFFIFGPIGAFIIVYVSFQTYRISADIAAHLLNGAPYRTITATITARSGLPGAFIIGDNITLDGKIDATLPFSDLPKEGKQYTFTLLPSDNIIVDYKSGGDNGDKVTGTSKGDRHN